MNAFSKALSLLSPSERRRGVLVGLIIIVVAVFEVLGVSSVIPFLSVLGNPNVIETNEILQWAYQKGGFASTSQFLFFLGVLVFAFLVLAAIMRSLGLYVQTRFALMRRHTIGARLLETYLRQPYEFFLNQHSSDLAKGILSEVDQVVGMVFMPLATMLAQAVVLAAMITMLIIADPWVVLIGGTTLSVLYMMIFLMMRGYLLYAGVERVENNKARFTATNEALTGIKDIRLLGRESVYLEQFSKPSRQMAKLIVNAVVLGQVPKFIMEAITFGGIILLSLVLLWREGGVQAEALGHILPLLGLYAFAGYRMLPAGQAIYRALAQLRFGAAAIDKLYNDMQAGKNLPTLEKRSNSPLPLTQEINIQSLNYHYPNSNGVGVKDIALRIPAGTTVGIVGTTGAGKTTLVDLILGLLKASSGSISIDGTALGPDTIRKWQSGIGYVPQSIFLMDASLAANIALGTPADEIDMDQVRACARLAQLADFIENELPEAYATEVGERGVRLSGGQRQRIGIARALYLNPNVLVFDEATSALDNQTEREVMQAIHNLQGHKTILMIAHRLTTIKNCDAIIVLAKGQIVGHGRYDDLMQSNPAFQKIAAGSDIL